jgi:MSHA biogenesis protein MshK
VFKSSHTFLFLFILASMTSQTAYAAKLDPTRPFGHRTSANVTPEGKKMVLESIIYGDGIHTVVISGKVLKIFDYIGEYQLTAVNGQSVILHSKTQRLKLDVFKGNIVKASIAK